MSEERLEAIEARLDALENRSRDVQWIEAKIVEAARQLGRVTKLGYVVDDKGLRVQLCGSDLKEYAEYYRNTIDRLASDLLRAETS